MYCDFRKFGSRHKCAACGVIRSKEVIRRCEKASPVYSRPAIERLEVIIEHCSNCQRFTDATTFDALKCSKIPSCGCLWKRASNRLFKCPAGKFQLGQEILDQYNARYH
jgi:hypothetical protein